MSQKDELPKDLNDTELLQLARFASEGAVDENTSRRDQIKTVKASLSVEEIKQKVEQIQSPPPTKRWTRNELFLGGVGQVFLMAWGFLGTLTPTVFPNGFGILPPFFYQRLSVWSMIGAAFLLVFAGLHMSSMLRIQGRSKGNKLGIAGASIALAASVAGILYYLLTYLELTFDTFTVYVPGGGSYTTSEVNALGVAIPSVYGLLVVMTMILVGLFFLVHRERFSSSELWMVTGLLYVLAGAFQLGYTPPYYVAFVVVASSSMFIVVGVMGMACFFTGRYAR